jgi:hypothetical protein
MSATPFGTRTVAVELLFPGVGSGVEDETVAVLTIGAGAGYPDGIAYVDVIVADAPAATVPRLHGKAVTHAPAFEMNVRPAGVGSVTDTACASDGPLSVTTVVKTTFGPPGTAVAGPVFAIDRSAEGAAIPVVVELLLPGTGSGVADVTVAVFEMAAPVGTAGLTFTMSVKTPGAAGARVAIVHETVPPAPTAGVTHTHPPGDASETNVVPAGSVSDSATVSAVDGPRFVAVSV